MSTVGYTLVKNQTGPNLIVWSENQTPQVVAGDHPRFQDILNGALVDDESIFDLIDLSREVIRQFKRLSDNVTLVDGQVCYSGDPIDSTLSNLIVRHLDEGVDDWAPLVSFLEKLYTNVDAGVRDNLFRWISDRDLTITIDGNILAYKGLRSDFTSIHAGPGIVNDVPTNGHLDNTPGNTVEIAKSAVVNNPGIGCASGLHAGTREYATDFAEGKLVVVEIDPAHVVSVPYECADQKMRVSKYYVLEEAQASYGAVYVGATNLYDLFENYDDEDDDSFTDLDPDYGVDQQVKYDSLGRPIPQRGPDGRFLPKQ